MKILKKVVCTVLVVVLCLTSAPLQGFVGFELPGLPAINIDFPDIDLGSWFTGEVNAVETLTYGDYEYIINDDETVSIAKYNGNGAELNIPQVINGFDVVEILENSFESNLNLIRIVIPKPIIKIGSYAFANCTNLVSVDLGDVEKLGYKIFEGCENLEKITIPNTVNEADADYWNGNGVLAGSGVKEVEFEYGIEAIPQYICAECTELEKIIIPETVTKICNNAFNNCVKLKAVNLPKALEIIEGSAFYNCELITEIQLYENILSIDESAFANCTNLVSVDLGDVEKLGYKIFEGCENLEKITIPNTVNEADADYWNGNGVLAGSGVKEVEFEYGIEAIPQYICAECTELEKIIIPETVTKICNNAFNNCVKLKAVNLPKALEIIEGSAFYNCELITEIQLYENILSIDESAFANCTNLVSVDLGDVENLGYKIFEGCENLEKITIPNTVNEADADYWNGNGVLAGSGVKEVEFEYGIEAIPQYICAECTELEKIIIPETVTKICNNAFNNCVKLKAVNLPKALEIIEGSAFYNCELITEIQLYENILSIDESAFANCTNLVSVDLGDVEKLGYKIFEGCENLKKITIPNTVNEADADYWNGNGVLAGSGVKEVEFEYGIEAIPQYICAECTELEEIIIPESVTRICNNAFNNCVKLKAVNLPKALEIIEGSAFYNCTDLKEVFIPERVKQIDDNAFRGCISLKEVKLPESLEFIGEDVFYGCDELLLTIKKEDSNSAILLIDKEYCFVADEHGIKDSDDRYLNRNSTTFNLGQQISSSPNGVMLTLKYDFKEQIKNDISECNIDIKIPSDVICDINTIKVNGKVWNDCREGDFISINNLPVSATITFKVYLNDTSYFASYAKINYRLNDKPAYEIIGLINSADEILTISALKETSSKSITVSGMAPPSKLVDVYLDGTYVKTVTSSKTGRYISDISLDKVANNKKFILEAKINDGKIIAKTEVLFSDKAVEILSAKMKYRGAEFDLIGLQGKKPVITWENGAYNFEIKVDKSNEVKHVIILNRNSEGNQILSCKYDSNKDLFVAEGFENDIIGTISVICITENNYDSMFENIILNDDFICKYEDEISENVIFKVKENTLKDNPTSGNFILNISSTNQSSEGVDIVVESLDIDEITVEKLNNNVNYQEEILDDGRKIYKSNTYNVGDSNKADVYYVNNDEVEKGYSFGVIGDALDIIGAGCDIFDIDFIPHDEESVSTYVTEGILKFFTNKTFAQVFNDYLDWSIIGSPVGDSIAKGLGGLYGRVAVSFANFVCSEDKYTWETFGSLFFSVCYLGLGLAIPEIAVPLSMLLTFLDIYSILDDYVSLEDIFKMLIDPSGYVYEVNTEDRISGVTTTAYWIPYDENDTEFWNESYPSDSKAILWDAEEYDQVNSLVTDENGCYAWDVPEGWWRVKYEKEGYETTWSEWLPVPPPQLDVNISMTTTEAPEVTDMIIEGNTVTVEFSQYIDVATVNTSNCIVKISNNIAKGSWAAVDVETYVKDENKQITKTFIFTASKDFGDNYSITVDNAVNYAGISMSESYIETTELAIHNHSFKDGESKCSSCDYDKADDCSCNCHKGGIAGFFFKLILFFQKIFKTNKVCKCGKYHY